VPVAVAELQRPDREVEAKRRARSMSSRADALFQHAHALQPPMAAMRDVRKPGLSFLQTTVSLPGSRRGARGRDGRLAGLKSGDDLDEPHEHRGLKKCMPTTRSLAAGTALPIAVMRAASVRGK